MADTFAQVAEDVFRVTDGHVNAYLVLDGDALTIVDTGFPWETERLERACSRVGRRPSDVEAILLTHAHADHLGGAEHFRAVHGARVRTHTEERDAATGLAPLLSSWKLVPRFLMRLARLHTTLFVMNATARGFLLPRGVREVEVFGDGESLDVPGTPVAIHTPGHTAGHAAYHLAARGVLLTGDALVTMNVLTGAEGPQLMPDPVQADPAQAASSLDRLTDRDAEVVLPGHGNPFEGSPALAVEKARPAATARQAA